MNRSSPDTKVGVTSCYVGHKARRYFSHLPTYKLRRVQAQGIHLVRLIYLSVDEFKFLNFLRLEFLKRRDKFFEESPKVLCGIKKEAQKQFTRKGPKLWAVSHAPGYEPTDISATRDSLFWSWRRVKEYYRDLLGLEDNGERKKGIRIDTELRRR